MHQSQAMEPRRAADSLFGADDEGAAVRVYLVVSSRVFVPLSIFYFNT